MKDTQKGRKAVKMIFLLLAAIVVAGGILYGVTSGSGKPSDANLSQETDASETDTSSSSNEIEEDADPKADDVSSNVQNEMTVPDQSDTTEEFRMIEEEEVDWDDSVVDEDSLQDEYNSLEEEDVTFPIVP